MSIRWLLAVVVGICGVAWSTTDENDDGADGLAMEWNGPFYRVRYTFTTACPRESLYAIFFNPVHVRRCMDRANLEIVTVDSGVTQNRISYTYSYLVSKLHLTFLRTRDSAGGRVSFELDSCRVSGSRIIPTVRSSRGHYAFVPQGRATRVDYVQETILDRDLNRLYVHFIRRDTRRVLRNQQRYADSREPARPAVVAADSGALSVRSLLLLPCTEPAW